jgi:hypothetical protein
MEIDFFEEPLGQDSRDYPNLWNLNVCARDTSTGP